MGLGVSGVARQTRINLSKISTSVDGAKNGDYVQINQAIFSQPGITYAQREDGVITIMSNGQVIGFTVADDMSNVTTDEAQAQAQAAEQQSAPADNQGAPAAAPEQYSAPQESYTPPRSAGVATYDASSVPMPEVPNITIETVGDMATA